MNQLGKEVIAYFKERSDKGVNPDSYRDNWQFSRDTTRRKLNRRYTQVNECNLKFK